jgi:hypothetical protein
MEVIDMTPNERAELRRMTPEERAEMRRHDKALRDEVLSWKRAVSAELSALKTDEEWHAHMKKLSVSDECRALGFNVG